MGNRPVDKIVVEGEDGTFDRFNSIEISNEIGAPSQCVMDVGDDGSYAELASIIGHGKAFKVYLNDRIRMTGRVVAPNTGGSAAAGTTTQIVVRTIMADAYYASADPKAKVDNTSLKDFVLALYRPLGLTAADFVFTADLERNLMTGVSARGATPAIKVEAIKSKAAKVNPPETIYEAAAKHLKRFGLLHWDTPDGKIYIGAPDDKQIPLYRFACKRGPASFENNLLDWKRTPDWTDVPTEVSVRGASVGEDAETAKRLRGVAEWADVKAAGFYRPVLVMDDGANSQATADARARRERSNRSKRKDCYDLVIDGWTCWDGDAATPIGVNTTCDIDIDAIGSPTGLYYIHRVVCSGSAQDGSTTAITVVAPGIFEV